jgi:hypothetical protein
MLLKNTEIINMFRELFKTDDLEEILNLLKDFHTDDIQSIRTIIEIMLAETISNIDRLIQIKNDKSRIIKIPTTELIKFERQKQIKLMFCMFYYTIIINMKLFVQLNGETDIEQLKEHIFRQEMFMFYSVSYIPMMFQEATFDLDDVVSLCNEFQSGNPSEFRERNSEEINAIGVRFVKVASEYTIVEYYDDQEPVQLPHEFGIPNGLNGLYLAGQHQELASYETQGTFTLDPNPDPELDFRERKRYKFILDSGEYFDTDMSYSASDILCETLLELLFGHEDGTMLFHYFEVLYKLFEKSNLDMLDDGFRFGDELNQVKKYKQERRDFIDDFNQANRGNLEIIPVEDDGLCFFRAIASHPRVQYRWQDLQAVVDHTLWGGSKDDVLKLENFLEMNICMIFRDNDGNFVVEKPTNEDRPNIYLYDYTADPNFETVQRHFDLVLKDEDEDEGDSSGLSDSLGEEVSAAAASNQLGQKRRRSRSDSESGGHLNNWFPIFYHCY